MITNLLFGDKKGKGRRHLDPDLEKKTEKGSGSHACRMYRLHGPTRGGEGKVPDHSNRKKDSSVTIQEEGSGVPSKKKKGGPRVSGRAGKGSGFRPNSRTYQGKREPLLLQKKRKCRRREEQKGRGEPTKRYARSKKRKGLRSHPIEGKGKEGFYDFPIGENGPRRGRRILLLSLLRKERTATKRGKE